LETNDVEAERSTQLGVTAKSNSRCLNENRSRSFDRFIEVSNFSKMNHSFDNSLEIQSLRY